MGWWFQFLAIDCDVDGNRSWESLDKEQERRHKREMIK